MHHFPPRHAAPVLGAALFLSLAIAPAAEVDFVRDVRPIFESRCYQCHSGAKQKGGLRLDLRHAALAGGDSGEPALRPSDPAASHLLQLVRGDVEGEVMPPKGERLTSDQIDVLTRWVRSGAVWPEGVDQPVATEHSHWAFRKPERPAPPTVRHPGWARNPIDLFVQARREAQGLSPADTADPYTLIRRLSLDLTGLPPTPEEVASFAADPDPMAYERLVDRLLASPRFGERWARLWLDLARYADSKGYGSDPLRPYMWRYRDWVIEAFNHNLPYAQFSIDQLAGDLLENPTLEQLLATSFHRNTMSNDEGGTDNEEFRVAAIKDRVDTTGQVWMGLTVGCAKCHSHKFDPVTQREYYEWFGLFNQTQDDDNPNDQPRLATPTLLQREKETALEDDIAGLDTRLATPEVDARDAGFRTWLARATQVEKKWHPIEITAVSSDAGTGLQPGEDGDITATGEMPPSDIYHIEARTDLQGITGFRLELLPSQGGDAPALGRGPSGNVFLSRFQVTFESPDKAPVRGRFVRVVNSGQNQLLSLAEVEVIGVATNLARAGKASQSSTAYDGPAHLAIDGNTDGNYNARSVTHTEASDDPWWEVDLGEAQDIERIVLWNRTDNGLQHRLRDYQVQVLDEARQPVWESSFAEAPNPSHAIVLGGPQPVTLAGASAGFAQAGAPVSGALDADPKTGWALLPRHQEPQQAVFRAARPVPAEGPVLLRFTLAQERGDQTTLGRFRIKATAEPDPLPAMPNEIQAVLAMADAERTPAQWASLVSFYWPYSHEHAVLAAERADLAQGLGSLRQQIVQTPIMQERPADQARETHVLLKGNFLNPGDAVRPGVPAAFHPLPEGAPTNRLGLALWLVDRDNPLTARVAVNRFWSALFGRGLVATEEDFGTMGLPPTHPLLLDWLAADLVDSGWDMKALLKQIVTSSTYRQSTRVDPAVREKDPDNLWLTHAPRLRLEAEMVRDQALFLAGLLSDKMLGPSVHPPQPPNLWRAAFNGERNWPTSEGEDKYRRGLYTFWRRTTPYPSMTTFDAPSREFCKVRRESTSTPLQAFVTLNDPVFVEASQALARRLMREGGDTDEARAAFGLSLCLARPATPEQIGVVLDLYRRERDHYRGHSDDARAMVGMPLGAANAGPDAAVLAAWTVVANVLLNMDAVLCKG